MKKLIAILLVLACMSTVTACSGVVPPVTIPTTPPSTSTSTQEALDALDTLIRTSTPTQSKVVTFTGSADIHLKSELTITMGELSGKTAALYVHDYEYLNDVGVDVAIGRTVETRSTLRAWAFV